MLHFCLLLDGIPRNSDIPVATELRFTFEVTPVINKRAGKRPAPSRHPRPAPAGGIALPFLYLVPFPACPEGGGAVDLSLISDLGEVDLSLISGWSQVGLRLVSGWSQVGLTCRLWTNSAPEGISAP